VVRAVMVLLAQVVEVVVQEQQGGAVEMVELVLS
jgi:hypothetical protein